MSVDENVEKKGILVHCWWEYNEYSYYGKQYGGSSKS